MFHVSINFLKLTLLRRERPCKIIHRSIKQISIINVLHKECCNFNLFLLGISPKEA